MKIIFSIIFYGVVVFVLVIIFVALKRIVDKFFNLENKGRLTKITSILIIALVSVGIVCGIGYLLFLIALSGS